MSKTLLKTKQALEFGDLHDLETLVSCESYWFHILSLVCSSCLVCIIYSEEEMSVINVL